MALFRKKQVDEGTSGESAEVAVFEPQPEKARKWFEHGRTASDTHNYDYALNCYANGIKLDPDTLSAHERMYEAAIHYANKEGRPAQSKEKKKLEEADTSAREIARFVAAEYEWMKDVRNGALAIKAVEAAVKADLLEVGHWIAVRSFGMVRNNKKTNKSLLLRAREVYTQVSAWDQAIAAGELALQLDPRDSDLEAELKNLAAQRAMDQGGYEKAGGEGGFRAMIKDADKQKELIDEESISANATVEERTLERARIVYEENPTIPDAINKYGTHLKRSGDPQNIELARTVYLEGYEKTREYRFRMLAGDIDIDRLRRAERALREKLAAGDESVAGALAEARKQRLQLESDEYGERVKRYPTDLTLKFELGQVEYELGRYNEAMACFQNSKDEPRYRVRSGHMLGRCFAAVGWHVDAIAEYREALQIIDATERDRELDIRYDLMLSLIEYAKSEQSSETAKEAREICSSIARRDITFRDIREKRGEVEAILKEFVG